MNSPLDAARLKSWSLAALVFGLLLAVYWPALRGELIWNDKDYVTRPELRSVAGLARIWTEPGATEQYYPLLHSAFWVEAKLWGDNPLGYHLLTVALHWLAAILFARLLQRLAVPGAWLAAFIFALHPVHVQSVAWITEQKNTLSLVCYLAAALAFFRFDATRARGAWAAAFALFALSLLCKTVTATLPAALLVVLWWRNGRLEFRRDVRPLLPWLALSVVSGLFTSWVEQRYVGARGEDFTLPLLERGLVAGRALWFYLGHVVWPQPLIFIYSRWTPDAAVWWQWLFPFGALALAGVLWMLRGRSRAPLAVFLIFAGSLFPMLGFVNLYGALYSWVWDHWQYLPDLAPIALVAAALARGWESLGPRARAAGPVAAAGLVAMLGVFSSRHAGTFRDTEILYRATLEKNPAAWMAHNNLANLLTERPGREAEALEHYQLALPGNPRSADVVFNQARVLSHLPGREAEAEARYEEALRLNPRRAATHYQLANLLARLPGRESELQRHYEAAVQLEPNFPEAHKNLGNLLARQPGREAEARAHYETAVRLRPDFAEAHNDLAALLARQPDHEAEVIAHLEAAVRLKPDFTDARFNLANHLARQPGREPEAILQLEEVLRATPTDADAHYILATLLANLGRPTDAIAHAQQAVRLKPDYPAARQLLDYLRAQPER